MSRASGLFILIRTVIFFALCTVNQCFGFFATTTLRPEHQVPPHIIVFMVDDLGWNDVSFHGSNEIPTPNIDALAYNGVILNRHYTLPSSTPSRSAFFTGKYPIRMGLQGDGLKAGEPRGIPLKIKILPEHLRGLGYTTKLIGKWHVGYHTIQHTPLHRGFDSFLGFYNSYVNYFNYMYSQGNMTGFDMHRGDHPAYDLKQEYITDLFTSEARRIISHHDPQRPLYLQVSHLAVHAPYAVQEFENNHNDKKFQHINNPARRIYAKMIESVDNSLGEIVEALGTKGMLKNCLILFLTDNGAPANFGHLRNTGSNFPLRGTKYTLYEGGVRGVAALWSSRLDQAARVSNQLIHITDWLPTLYSLAGGRLRDLGEIDGIDQWDSLRRGTSGPREALLLNIDEESLTEGAIYERFKLVRGSYEGGRYDLHFMRLDYGLSRDPYHREAKNIYDKKPVNDTVYADMVMKSAVTGSITMHLGGPTTQPSMLYDIRNDATVECDHDRDTFRTCNVSECLFDIINDPCELNNVAEVFSTNTIQIGRYLESYAKFVIRQRGIYVDSRANPQRKNGTWGPWIKPSAMNYMEANSAVGLGTSDAFVFCIHALLVSTLTALRGI